MAISVIELRTLSTIRSNCAATSSVHEASPHCEQTWEGTFKTCIHYLFAFRSLFNKEEHLIYGSPANRHTTVPNDSPVLAPANNTVRVDRTVLPKSAKSSVLNTSVPQASKNSNETSVSSAETQRGQNQHKQDNWRQDNSNETETKKSPNIMTNESTRIYCFMSTYQGFQRLSFDAILLPNHKKQ